VQDALHCAHHGHLKTGVSVAIPMNRCSSQVQKVLRSFKKVSSQGKRFSFPRSPGAAGSLGLPISRCYSASTHSIFTHTSHLCSRAHLHVWTCTSRHVHVLAYVLAHFSRAPMLTHARSMLHARAVHARSVHTRSVHARSQCTLTLDWCTLGTLASLAMLLDVRISVCTSALVCVSSMS